MILTTGIGLIICRSLILAAPRASVAARAATASVSSASRSTGQTQLFLDHRFSPFDSIRSSANDEVLLLGIWRRVLVHAAVSAGGLGTKTNDVTTKRSYNLSLSLSLGK